MRVLQANKFFFLKGGSERYLFDLLDLLPARGHAVAPFSMHHPSNRPTPYAEHFVSRVEYDTGGLAALGAATRTVYNRETRAKALALVDAFRPDVAHLHNVHHQLSGALFEALRERAVPVVQTLHDFQWACPVYTFLRDGSPCTECGHGRVFPAVRHRCQSGSLARSVIAALELKVGQWRGWMDCVARFLAPSRFLADTLVAHGLPADRMETLPNCLRADMFPSEPGERGASFLYAGRLSAEKGIEVLLEALESAPGLTLRVAGTGPLEEELHRRAQPLGDRVRFLGHLDEVSLRGELARARALVVPSTWYENQPYVVLEAFASWTPVIGSAIGGIPELVRDGETGFLVEPGSAPALADAMLRLQPREAQTLGRAARREVTERFDPDSHLDRLLAVYEAVVA